MDGIVTAWRSLLPFLVLVSLVLGTVGFGGDAAVTAVALTLAAAACLLLGAQRFFGVTVRPAPVPARGGVVPLKPLANRPNRPGLVRPRAPGC